MNVKSIKNKGWSDRSKLARVGIITGGVLLVGAVAGGSAGSDESTVVEEPWVEAEQVFEDMDEVRDVVAPPATEAPVVTEAPVELHPPLVWFVAQLDSIELIDGLNDDLVAGIESGNIALAADSAGAIAVLYTDLFFDAPSGTDYTSIVVEDTMLTCGLAHDLAADALVSGDAWSLEYAAGELDECANGLEVINGLMADAAESF